MSSEIINLVVKQDLITLDDMCLLQEFSRSNADWKALREFLARVTEGVDIGKTPLGKLQSLMLAVFEQAKGDTNEGN